MFIITFQKNTPLVLGASTATDNLRPNPIQIYPLRDARPNSPMSPYSLVHRPHPTDVSLSSTYIWRTLTVGLLVAGAGAGSTELLGLAAPRVGHQQRPVVLDQNVLDFFLRGLVHICNRPPGRRITPKHAGSKPNGR